MPSENQRRGKLSEYEPIGIMQRWPENLQCESEKVLQPQTASENFCPSYHLIDHLKICLVHTVTSLVDMLVSCHVCTYNSTKVTLYSQDAFPS